MQKFKAITLLSLISVISVITLFYGSASALFISLPTSEAPADTSPPASEKQETAATEEPKTETPEIEASVSSEASSAVPVVENHTVSGKIITKTISPQSAALSYNNIYIKNSTGTTIDIKSELESAFSLKLSSSGEPQVLILHTHATESYMLEERDYYTTTDAARSTDKQKNMIAVGKKIADRLRAAGIGVLHDETLHDYPSYSGSYNASAATIKEYLKKYPSIKIVLDVHRDAVSSGNDKTKLVKEIGGKKAAQVMLVMGSNTGVVTSYPNWKQNLRLAMRFHKTLEETYPGLARPMLVASKKYNQNLSSGAMLIEIGTDANTLEEALYSAELVGDALGKLLSSLK